MQINNPRWGPYSVIMLVLWSINPLSVQVRRLAGQSQNSALSSLGMYDGHVIECAILLQDSDRIEVCPPPKLIRPTPLTVHGLQFMDYGLLFTVQGQKCVYGLGCVGCRVQGSENVDSILNKAHLSQCNVLCWCAVRWNVCLTKQAFDPAAMWAAGFQGCGLSLGTLPPPPLDGVPFSYRVTSLIGNRHPP